MPFANSSASNLKRAGFITKHLWVTPYKPDEKYAPGDYPNQHPGGAGLPDWTRADRRIENTDNVVWYTLGGHHVPLLEDWPVMPVSYIGFRLKPLGFFMNPARDVPPSHHHKGLTITDPSGHIRAAVGQSVPSPRRPESPQCGCRARCSPGLPLPLPAPWHSGGLGTGDLRTRSPNRRP